MASDSELKQMFEMFKATLESSKKDNIEMMKELLKAAKEPNAVQAEELKEHLAKQRRKADWKAMMAAEHTATSKNKGRCTHRVIESGRRMGTSCSANDPAGTWITSGQAHGNGFATLVCLRCSDSWTYKISQEDYQAISDGGLLFQAPPPLELCVKVNGTDYRDGRPLPVEGRA